MKTYRPIIYLVIVAVLAVAPLASAQTISFWHGYSEVEAIVLEEQVIPLFEAQNPGLKVESVPMGYDELRDRLVTSALADAGPDVVRVDIIWTPGLGATGLLEPLSDYEGFDEILASVYPGPLSTNRYLDEYYGLPLTTNTQVYVYNRGLFEESGLTPPVTMDDFHDVTRRLTRMDGATTSRYGYDFGGPWNWNLLPWIWSNGGAITDPDITTASGYLDSPGTVGMIELINEWNLSGILAPNLAGEGFDGWGAFTSGMTAARQDGPWFGNFLQDNHPDLDVGYALIPAADGVVSSSVVGGENIVIARGSKDKDAAWKFVQFMLSHDAQSIMATTGQIPVIQSAASLPEFQESPFYPVYLEQLMTAQARTPHPNYADIENIMQDAWLNVFSGTMAAGPAISEATRLVNEILE